MSWKLAELRWRHDIGLNEGTLTRTVETGQREQMLHKSTDVPGPVKRGRSYTAPWCGVFVESTLDGVPANSTPSPELTSQSLPTGPSDSSTVPLLVAMQGEKDVDHTPPSHTARCMDRTAISLQEIQTSSRFKPLQRSDVPDASFDGLQRALLAQAGIWIL